MFVMGDVQYLTVTGDIRFSCVILVGFKCMWVSVYMGECGCLRVY